MADSNHVDTKPKLISQNGKHLRSSSLSNFLFGSRSNTSISTSSPSLSPSNRVTRAPQLATKSTYDKNRLNSPSAILSPSKQKDVGMVGLLVHERDMNSMILKLLSPSCIEATQLLKTEVTSLYLSFCSFC